MTRSSRIFSIFLVKNEADVVGHCLAEATKWSDRIFVFDNGSTDGTWEIVQGMASDVVVPWKQDDRPYSDAIRSHVFNHFRHEARQGDWWCKLDADEFYIVDPRDFLAKVPQRHHVVWGLAANFYLTRGDLEAVDFSAGFQHVRSSIRHFRADSSEARFFRHRDKLDWPLENASWPRHMGVVHPEMIPFRHYQFRSPDQMRQRLATRRDAVERGYREYWARVSYEWEDHLADPLKCQKTTDDGQIELDRRSLPSDHIEPLPRRMLKRVLHGCGVWP
jgi:glycosyltransferase involved in cell wall biosynthesis